MATSGNSNSKIGTRKVLFPFEVGRFLLLPGRKLYGFLIETEAERGAFTRILHVASKHNARLKLAHFYTANGGKVKVVKVFFDCTDCATSPRILRNEISKSKSVLTVTPINSEVEGFIADTVSSPILIGGVKAVLLHTPSYEGLIKRVRERFGSAAEAFLYYQGIEIGMEYAKEHREIGHKLGIADPLKIFRNITLPMFTCMGIGSAEIIKHKAKPFYMLIRIHNLFECDVGRGAKQPYSQIMRGVIAGILMQLFGVRTTAKETLCIAKGDPYCEFEVKLE